MRRTNDEERSHRARPTDRSRRDFIMSAATTLASASAASVLHAQPAPGANATMSATNATGPYPTEGMAAYAPTGPHKRMTFRRRALGPKDVAQIVPHRLTCARHARMPECAQDSTDRRTARAR